MSAGASCELSAAELDPAPPCKRRSDRRMQARGAGLRREPHLARQLGPHVGFTDHLALAQDDQSLDEVLELAHVARPALPAEGAHRVLVDGDVGLAVCRAARLAKVRDQEVDVLSARAERGQPERDDVESIEEIQRETAGARPSPRGRGEWPRPTRRSTLIVLVPPSRSSSRSCNKRRSFACSGRLSSPISSRKSVPLSASSAPAGLARGRAGERALLVAEELALEQVLGQRRAVDLDEGLVGSR